MKHPLNHRKTLGASLVGAAVLAMGLLTPFAASADSKDRVRVAIKGAVAPVSYNSRRDHRYRNDYRNSRSQDRLSRLARNTRFFVKPHRPLNFKHWWRVERRVNAYAPNIRGLNRYEVRQALGHSYDRYLRDHRRWSKRVDRAQHRNRWIARNDYYDRKHDDRRNDRNRYRRW